MLPIWKQYTRDELITAIHANLTILISTSGIDGTLAIGRFEAWLETINRLWSSKKHSIRRKRTCEELAVSMKANGVRLSTEVVC